LDKEHFAYLRNAGEETRGIFLRKDDFGFVLKFYTAQTMLAIYILNLRNDSWVIFELHLGKAHSKKSYKVSQRKLLEFGRISKCIEDFWFRIILVIFSLHIFLGIWVRENHRIRLFLFNKQG
jgi:hypothetical protein